MQYEKMLHILSLFVFAAGRQNKGLMCNKYIENLFHCKGLLVHPGGLFLLPECPVTHAVWGLSAKQVWRGSTPRRDSYVLTLKQLLTAFIGSARVEYGGIACLTGKAAVLKTAMGERPLQVRRSHPFDPAASAFI